MIFFFGGRRMNGFHSSVLRTIPTWTTSNLIRLRGKHLYLELRFVIHSFNVAWYRCAAHVVINSTIFTSLSMAMTMISSIDAATISILRLSMTSFCLSSECYQIVSFCRFSFHLFWFGICRWQRRRGLCIVVIRCRLCWSRRFDSSVFFSDILSWIRHCEWICWDGKWFDWRRWGWFTNELTFIAAWISNSSFWSFVLSFVGKWPANFTILLQHCLFRIARLKIFHFDSKINSICRNVSFVRSMLFVVYLVCDRHRVHRLQHNSNGKSIAPANHNHNKYACNIAIVLQLNYLAPILSKFQNVSMSMPMHRSHTVRS